MIKFKNGIYGTFNPVTFYKHYKNLPEDQKTQVVSLNFKFYLTVLAVIATLAHIFKG